MKKVIILSGVSGSGKSTLAKMLASVELNPFICSADKAFMDGGEYKFDVTKLEAAHKACFADFVTALAMPKYSTIIIDNTNLQNWEMAGYIQYANHVGAEIQIIRVHSSLTVKQLAERNIHGVPEKSIKAMMERMEELPYPWKKYEVKP